MEKIMQEIKQFNEERDWGQFHTPENLAKSIAIEAGELLECFQWDVNNVNTENVKEELADVMLYCLYLSHHYGFSIKEIMMEKVLKNEMKYPVEKARGNCKKYTEL